MIFCFYCLYFLLIFCQSSHLPVRILTGILEMRILQVNVNRSYEAHDMAFLTAERIDADIIIASEPNARIISKGGWVADNRKNVAVYFRNRKIEVDEVKGFDGFIHIKVQTVNIYGIYSSPNIDILQYERDIDTLMRKVSKEKVIVVLGDFNAKAPEWGAPIQDRRGEIILEWIATLNLIVHNDGSPTFARGAIRSHIDITFSSQNIARKISGWEVIEEEGLTDHLHIKFDINVGKSNKRIRWKEKQDINMGKLKRNLERLKVYDRSEISPDLCGKELKRAYMDAREDREGRINMKPYWWKEEIEECRRACTRLRRLITRTRARNELEEQLEEAYKGKKKDLRAMIRSAKKEAWKELCDKLNEDIWGDGYRIVKRQLDGPTLPFELSETFKRQVLEHLFPARQDVWEINETADGTPFSLEEIQKVGEDVKTGKASGLDGIPPEVVKEAIKVAPNFIRETMNGLLKKQKFPKEWKEARVVLLWKAGKNMENPGAYRPICLINVIAKVYETLVKDRLTKEIEEKGNLSENQYGFRRGRSTVQAIEKVLEFPQEQRTKLCLMITLDVRNAFNTASWELIIAELRTKGISGYLINIIGDYFKNRTVKLGKISKKMTAGVPQGSVLGPVLWNILYDGVLKLRLPKEAKLIGFADDLALLVGGNDIGSLNMRVNDCLTRIDEWLVQHQLELAPEKTEAVFLRCPKNVKMQTNFYLRGTQIEPKKAIKYLGMMIDWQVIFGEHIRYVCKKADIRTTALAKLLPNIKGPNCNKRRVLAGVVQSTVLYAAPIWSKCLRIDTYRKTLLSTQRKILLRVTSAYRTVSTLAVQVIAGIPPIDLLAEERRRIYTSQEIQIELRNKMERRETMGRWQSRWNEEEEKASWTRRLIKNIRAWVESQHRRTDYYFTQFLSNHGAFSAYLKRFKLRNDGGCMECLEEEEDNAEHAIFYCPAYGALREDTRRKVGVEELNADNIIDIMLESKEKWENIYGMVIEIMKYKEEADRARA